MKLYMENTGTKPGFKNYHGGIFYWEHLICEWNYNKRQKCFISTVKLSDGTVKRLHAGSPEKFLPAIEKLVKRGEIELPDIDPVNEEPPF